MVCNIDYIPIYLHSADKPDIDTFELGEFIYRRCKKENLDNPFDTFQLYDISVNRQGMTSNKLCEPEDVLWNYATDKNFEKHDEAIVYMQIKELNEENKYFKKSDVFVDKNNIAELKLTHKKTPCNYAHCTFEIWYNAQEVNRDNYKETIRRNSILKTWCKNELAKMQIKGEVKMNW